MLMYELSSDQFNWLLAANDPAFYSDHVQYAHELDGQVQEYGRKLTAGQIEKAHKKWESARKVREQVSLSL